MLKSNFGNKRQSQKKDELYCKNQQVSIDIKDIEILSLRTVNSIVSNSSCKIQFK